MDTLQIKAHLKEAGIFLKNQLVSLVPLRNIGFYTLTLKTLEFILLAYTGALFTLLN